MSSAKYNIDTINTALKLLTQRGEPGTPIEEQLERNVRGTTELLNLDYCNIHTLVPELNILEDDSVRWKFICLCFYTLLSVKVEEDIISVSHLNNKRNTLQFIVSLGIARNLAPGIGIPAEKRGIRLDNIPQDAISAKNVYWRLAACVDGLLKCLSHVTLRNFVIAHHLNDIITALIYLAHVPAKAPNNTCPDYEQAVQFHNDMKNNKAIYKRKLTSLIMSIHPAHMMQSLMILNGCVESKQWFRRQIVLKLNNILISKTGVKALINTLIEPYIDDTGTNWQKYDIIAQLLVKTPAGVHDINWRRIHSQIVELVAKTGSSENIIKPYERIAALYIKRYHEVDSEACKKCFIDTIFIDEILQYNKIANGTEKKYITNAIQKTISMMYMCFVESCVNEPLLPMELLTPIVHIMFRLHVAIDKYNLSNTQYELNNILIKYVNNFSEYVIDDIFNSFLFNKEVRDIINLKSNIEFILSSNGREIAVIAGLTNNTRNFIENINCFSKLLETAPDGDTIYSLYRYLIEDASYVYLSDAPNPAFPTRDPERQLATLHFLSIITFNKKFAPFTRTYFDNMIIFIEKILQIVIGRNEPLEKHHAYYEIVFAVLMILNEVSQKAKMLPLWQNVHKYLKIICDESPDSDLKAFIKIVPTNENPSQQSEEPLTEFGQAMQYITDHLLPIRGHALLTFAKLIEQGDEEILAQKKYIMHLCLEHLKCKDSYIYLNTIKVLVALGKICPEMTLQTLCVDYRTLCSSGNENRLKLGEVIVQIVKTLGTVALEYKSLLLNTCLSCARDDDHWMRSSALSILGNVCHVLGYNLEHSITYVLRCFDEGMRDDAVEVRRAAVTIIRQLFAGLKKDAFVILKYQLVDIFRTLKRLYTEDPDNIIKLQAQLALEELFENVRDLVFPIPISQKFPLS